MAILIRIPEEIKDLITFHNKLPDINEEVLKKHDIPLLESYKKKELLNESYKEREVLNANKNDYKSQNYDWVTEYIVDTINQKQEASDKSYSHIHSSATREFNSWDLDYQFMNNRIININGDPYYQPEMQKSIRTSVDLFHQQQNNSEVV